MTAQISPALEGLPQLFAGVFPLQIIVVFVVAHVAGRGV